MTSSIYTNTGIVDKCWNSRGLITDNYVTRNCVITDRGILYAIFRDNSSVFNVNDIKIRVSTDNGFSWTTVANIEDPASYSQAISALNTNGPIMHLLLDGSEKGKEDLLTVFFGYRYEVTQEYRIRFRSYKINTDNSLTLMRADYVIGDKDFLAFDATTNNNTIFLTYAWYNRLRVSIAPSDSFQTYSNTSLTVTTTEQNYFDIIATNANDDDTLDILGVQQYAKYHLVYTKMTKANANIQSTVTIKIMDDADPHDLNIARDGYGNILALWTELAEDNAFAKIYWSLSKDNGLTWTTASEIKPSSNDSDFIDTPLQRPAGRTVLMPGLQGFIIGYIRKRLNKGVAYVRTLTTTNGNDYTLSDQRIAASHATKEVTGIRFFRPSDTSKIDLNNIGDVRFAYQLNQGNRTGQNDTIPVYFGQKLLKDEAYTESIYTIRPIDTPLQNQLLCSFNLIGSTALNIDYYNEGLIGNLTNKYLSAFNRFGTSIELIRYEPNQSSELDNRLAFYKTESIFIKVYFDDINYSSPELSGTQNFGEYIERDTRQIHLPPNMHLARTFLLNDGNKIKRTVWIAKFGGNEYELTQVVPKFIDNQIVYYTSNAYVVGPSRDPFSRVILPSET